MSVHVTEKYLSLAAKVVARAHANGGLAPLDVERFWADQAAALADPFGPAIPQAPLGAICNWECVFDELGVGDDWWRYDHNDAWRLALHKQYNDKAERIVGRRLLDESPPSARPQYPATKMLHDVFEMERKWVDRSWWLMESARTPDELAALLDRVDSRDIRRFILPPDWAEARARLLPRGIRPPLYRAQRGPVTFATSLYGAENLIFLILDQPDLAARLRDTILRVMLEIARVLDEEAGYTPETAPRGFYFSDDNCCLLTPAMYEWFGYPILEGVFDRYAPAPGDMRGQHSDSAMGHLLPLLGRLGLTTVNFGPTLTVTEIRRRLPRAVIHGQLAPFTFSRNEEVNIVAEFLRDFEMARPARGLVFATAGSINNGSRLTGMRLMMATIQEFGRYDR